MKHSLILIFTLSLLFPLHAQNLRGSVRTAVGEGVGAGSTQADIMGFVLGPILFFLSFVVVWNNERKASLDYRRLSILRQLRTENKEIMIQSEEKELLKKRIIYASGKTQILANVQDNISGISLQNAIRLNRVVEVREYRSFNSKQGEEELFWVTYNDPKVNNKVNEHQNWIIQSHNFYAEKVKIGSYFLSKDQKRKFKSDKELQPSIQIGKNILSKSPRKDIQPVLSGNYLYLPKEKGNLEQHGTLRVRFEYCEDKVATIVSGIADGNLLQPFRIDIFDNKGRADDVGCCKTCTCCFLCNCTAELLQPIQQVDLFSDKEETFQEMIDHQLATHACAKNTLRILSLVMMILGVYFLFWPITELIGYIPIVGGWIKSEANSMILVGAIIVTIPTYVLTFGIGWVRYNPKAGLPIIVFGLICVGVLIGVGVSEG